MSDRGRLPGARFLASPAPAWLPPRAALKDTVAGTLRYPAYGIHLAEYVARLLPEAGMCSVLDVGAGRGELASMLQRFRPETKVLALETFIRPDRVPGVRLARFDGIHIPLDDASVDITLLMNVLHHAARPLELLQEVRRATRSRIIVKDHLAETTFDHFRLTALDVAGNAGSGAVVRGKYLSRAGWERMLAQLAGVNATWHDGLEFRSGLIERLFPNYLEVMIQLDIERR